MDKYVEEFCEYTGYKSLMPIEYECIEDDGKVKKYKKVKCNCKSIMNTTCEKQSSCKHFIAAEEIVSE